jgi:1-acyl-sn-glycerol-3-phosphate acyltransferase
LRKLAKIYFCSARAVIDKILFPLFSRRECIGVENFPSQPPYIIAINHLALFDTPLVATVCPHIVRGFVAAKHKRNVVYAAILEAAGAIWVRRGEIDRQALRKALDVLKCGEEALGIAPEGTRARGPYALQEAKTGTAYLAARADVPIVPVGITGTEKVKRNFPRLRSTDIRIVIGKPFRLPESGYIRGAKLREYTDLIMQRIAELLPEEYRGVYA